MGLVSAIISFLDPNERFFQEAIESVLAQNYQELELLLVNDGSSAAASDLAAQMAEKYPDKITCLHHPGQVNKGLSASRNLGVRYARGDYIAFLDADDVWLPGKIAEQVRALDKNPEVAMLFGRTLYWYSWTGCAEDQNRDLLPELGVAAPSTFQPPEYLELSLKGYAWVPCTCSILLRRHAIEAVGGFEESFRDLYEDQVFYAKILLKYPVLAMAECWDKYRRHSDSLCAVGEEEQKSETSRQAYLNWLAEYLREEGCRDRTIWRALGQQQLISRICLRAPVPGRVLRRSLKALAAARRVLA